MAQVSKHHRVEFRVVNKKRGIGGVTNRFEDTRIEEKVRLLRRGMHADSRNELIFKDGSEQLTKPGGPSAMDPIIMEGAESYVDQDWYINQDSCDPILLCEVGRDPGRGFIANQITEGALVHGPALNDGPLEGIRLELNVVPNTSVSSRDLGTGLVVDSFLEESSVDHHGETGTFIGPEDETPLNIAGSLPGIGDESGSMRTEETGLEKVNFRDESVRPIFPTPVGFSWVFLEGGWALRPSVLLTDSVETDVPLSPVDVHSSSVVIATSDSIYESDDSSSEFERKLKVLLPDLHGGSDEVAGEKSRGIRKS